jgi:hypothetical protein
MGKDEAERKLTESDNRNKEIMKYGISAKAVITKYTWLGINVNGENPAVEFELLVTPGDRPALSAVTIGFIMNQSVPKYQPGKEIYIKYDSSNTKNVTIDHS